MRIQTASLTLALCLLSPLALSQTAFEEYDTDNDGVISEMEFGNAADEMGTFDKWDYNNDDLLDENEFNEIGLNDDFGAWDMDADGYLDNDEFYDGIYDTFDDTEDGHWQEGEWDDAGEEGILDV